MMENNKDLAFKLAECERREKELSIRIEELTDFFENASLPLHWVDSQGKIIWANKAELDFLGYPEDEYLGFNIKDFHADENTIDDILSRLGNNEMLTNYQARLKCKDGSIRYVLINSNVYRKNSEFIHTRCFTRDITEIKNEELKREELLKQLELKNQAVYESEERFRTLANSAPVLLWLSGADKSYYFFNKGWLEYTGRAAEEENGNSWTESVHPDDLQRCLNIYNKSFDAREEFYMEYRLERYDGEYHWISDNGVPRFTPDGEFLGFVGSCVDIHEQKNFAQELEDQVRERTDELKILNELLLSKNKQLEHSNEELSSFSYAASHDLQAPLRKISTFSSFIANKDGDKLSEDSKMYLKRISSATGRMQDLIDSLLNYSRINAEKIMFEKTDLNEMFVEVKNNLSDLLEEENVRIETSSLPVVDVVPLQFQQLFVNLISNSIKYRKKDVQSEITIDSSLVPGNEIKLTDANPDLNYWKITFSDNGIGFEQEYEHKIFELFHRLHGKNEYEGTGVGLGIVKKIILNHDGFITATGKPGEGAVFDVYIPESRS